MEQLGLMPSYTGEPGGERTGQRVTHYIIYGGAFARVCDDLIRSGTRIRYVEQHDDAKASRKAASKTRYTCPVCSANAWAKPNAHLVCGECREVLRSGVAGKRGAYDRSAGSATSADPEGGEK